LTMTAITINRKKIIYIYSYMSYELVTMYVVTAKRCTKTVLIYFINTAREREREREKAQHYYVSVLYFIISQYV